MIAGRIARIETASVARSGLSPSATAPSCHERGTEPSASVINAVMIGVIITVRITTETSSPAPVSWITLTTDSLSPELIRWLPTNGTSTSTPISP